MKKLLSLLFASMVVSSLAMPVFARATGQASTATAAKTQKAKTAKSHKTHKTNKTVKANPSPAKSK